jgi:16S rRNA (cytosine1402-N4)-methyltransferase
LTAKANGAPEDFYHEPVLLAETVDLLVTEPDAIYVDATLGGGGHSREILSRLGPRGRLISIDRDPEALARSRQWASEHSDRVTLVRGDFCNIASLLGELGVSSVCGILADLGVSSRQLDKAERGFSFMREGPLDMRMDPDSGPSAADLVNGMEEAELLRIIRAYGEHPQARKIAQGIVESRQIAPITTTGQLADLVERTIGRRSGKHPATLVFQALRIAVNRELEALEKFMADFFDLLQPGGRIAVIAYHSLEDRLVKRTLRDMEPHCICPEQAPRCTCSKPGVMKSLQRKAYRPSPEEVARNPRARSARLRVAERIDQGGF